MTKIKKYRYYGKNGILTTTILINDTNPILMYAIKADENKVLTNGNKMVKETVIFAEELDEWSEIEIPKDNSN